MDKAPKVGSETPIPGDIHSIAAEIVKQMSTVEGISRENSGRVEGLITQVLTERIGVFDDVRMGRILGSAIAMI